MSCSRPLLGEPHLGSPLGGHLIEGAGDAPAAERSVVRSVSGGRKRRRPRPRPRAFHNLGPSAVPNSSGQRRRPFVGLLGPPSQPLPSPRIREAGGVGQEEAPRRFRRIPVLVGLQHFPIPAAFPIHELTQPHCRA
jgi:hypothetical protein